MDYLELEKDFTKNIIAHCGNNYIRCPFEDSCTFQIHSTGTGKISKGCQLEEAYQFFNFLSQLSIKKEPRSNNNVVAYKRIEEGKVKCKHPM